MTRRCPSCASENGADSRYCAGCGVELPPPPPITPEETLVVRAPARRPAEAPEAPPQPGAPADPPGARSDTTPPAAPDATPGTTPTPITGGGPPVAGDATLVVAQRVSPQPRARMQNGEVRAGEGPFAVKPNVVRVRGETPALRERASRLAPQIRELSVGEPVQLQLFGPYFARVRLADGTEGYIERRHITTPIGTGISLSPEAVGLTGFGAAALLALIGLVAAWFKDCASCTATSGVDLAEGKLALLVLLGGVVALAARFVSRDIPAVRLSQTMSASGVLIALLALLAAMNHGGGASQFGLYLTILSGAGMAAAPWADRFSARLRRDGPP